MTTDLKVGVIGSGGHAQSHFAMIKAEPRMHLEAIAELDEERRAKAQVTHEPNISLAIIEKCSTKPNWMLSMLLR